MKKITKKIMAVLLVLSLSVPVCFGCFLFGESISFTRHSFELVYNESIDLDEYIEIRNATSRDYTLSASPSDIVQISGSTIKAVGAGTATVTAKLAAGGQVGVSVTVKYAETTGIELFSSGSLYQDLASAESVTFSAFLGEGADASQKINWYVNGEMTVAEEAADESFTLPKSTTAGTFAVKAELASETDIFAEKTVRVYAPYDIPVLVYDGEYVYENPDQTIFFSFDTEQTAGNPEYLFEMYVNGELKESIISSLAEFEFSPESAGIYTFEFKINGKTIRTAQDEQSLTVRFKGVVTPFGLSLDFDNDYPSVYLKWGNRENTLFTISVTQSTGTKTITDVDASKGFYDIGGNIDITKNGEISVTSQTYGEIYLGGATAIYNHTAVDSAGVQYLNKKFLSSNYYMISDDEVLEIFDFMLYFRPGATARGSYQTSECAVYIGYSTSASAQTYLNRFRTRLTITGSYLPATTLKNKVLTITIDFYSADSPTNFSTNGKLKHEVFIAPETSQTGYSGDLPFESFKTSASYVSNSNQLFYTLENGLKPVFASATSAAATLFDNAASALRGITDNGMTGAEMIRAIFDYVMFCTSYDDRAAENTSIDYAVLQPAFYPEGVLDTGFAVCDGISKTLSLLCNMMGIKCLRIVGTANSGGGSGDHAWNKVMLEGQWYIVDATWGIAKTNVDGVTYKLGSHDYFLLSDADVAKSHTEMKMGYPKTAQIAYGWYGKVGRYFYHTDTAGLNTQVDAFANQIYAIRNKKNYVVRGQSYNAAFVTFEIQTASTLISSFKNDGVNRSFLMTALYNKGIRNIDYWISGNTVVVAFK